MTIRAIVAATALAVGLATPVVAQEGQAFGRSGRAFDVSASRSDVSSAAAYRQRAIRSNAPRRAYVSDNTGRMAGFEAAAPVEAPRMLNVWGARLQAPTY